MATIVTGGGRGIGRTITLRMARVGPVIPVGKTPEDLDAVCRDVAAAGHQAEPCAGDVADPETARRAVALAETRGWAVDSLVCNAGIGKSGPTESFDPETWRRIYDVNVHGTFHFIQACLPGMLARGSGTVCLMSSVGGLRGMAFDAAYSSTKHALVGLARSLALEYGKRGLVVVPICPGFVESEMTDRAVHGLMRRHKITEEEAVRKIAATNPQRRIIPAEEVAEAVALICSGSVPSLAGTPFVLSGGL